MNKKLFISFSIFLLLFYGCSEKPLSEKQRAINAYKEKQKEQYIRNLQPRVIANIEGQSLGSSRTDIIPGKMQNIYYESGNLRAETLLKDGKVEGIIKEYYESGELYRELSFKDGKHEGIMKEYYPSGELYREIPYKDGQQVGIEKKYYKSGELMLDGFVKDGEPDEIEKLYY